MAFWLDKDGVYATVWKVEDKGNYVQARITSSSKKQDGTYENSSWLARFIGGCKSDALKLQEKDRIKIMSGNISNVYNKERETSFLTVAIFKFDNVEGNQSQGGNYKAESNDEELPF